MSSTNHPFRRTGRRSQSNTSRQSTLGYWVPLGLTITFATIGLAAWIWSERQEDDESEGGDYGRDDGSVRTAPPTYGDLRPGETAYGTAPRQSEESSGYMARMSGALRRTPSPQQLFDSAGRHVAAGVAAAGAAVGGALSSIREEDRHAYADHQTWSQEAEARRAGLDQGPLYVAPDTLEAMDISSRAAGLVGSSLSRRSPVAKPTGKRKTVAVVVSADASSHGGGSEEDIHHEHAVSYVVYDSWFRG